MSALLVKGTPVPPWGVAQSNSWQLGFFLLRRVAKELSQHKCAELVDMVQQKAACHGGAVENYGTASCAELQAIK